jgi:hypothetical protein
MAVGGGRAPVVVALQLAVPLWLAELEALPKAEGDALAQKWADAGATLVVEHGEDPQYDRPGRRAVVVRGLARGLAALARCPGGVRFLDLMWCSRHSTGGRPAESWEACCRYCVSAHEGVQHLPDRPEPLRRLQEIIVREVTL